MNGYKTRVTMGKFRLPALKKVKVCFSLKVYIATFFLLLFISYYYSCKTRNKSQLFTRENSIVYLKLLQLYLNMS